MLFGTHNPYPLRKRERAALRQAQRERWGEHTRMQPRPGHASTPPRPFRLSLSKPSTALQPLDNAQTRPPRTTPNPQGFHPLALCGQRPRGRSDHPKAVRAIPPQLLHQPKLPVQVGLHGLTRAVGAFVGAAVAVDAGRRQARDA